MWPTPPATACAKSTHRERLPPWPGTGNGSIEGEGGPATNAGVPYPTAVATDLIGNVFVLAGSRVRRIDTHGTITTLAGTGGRGVGGDGGPATGAMLDRATGLALDPAGNVYVADLDGRRVRKIDASGTISTVAGNEECCIRKDGVQATDISLPGPSGAVVDTVGNVVISGISAHQVRKVDPMGIITTVAGTGHWNDSADTSPTTTNTFLYPRGAALDAYGNLYFGDDQRIWKLDAEGTATAFAGSLGSFGEDGGPATEARLEGPAGVVTDTIGNVYVTEQLSGRVRQIDAMGIITTIAGSGDWGYGGDGGPATAAEFSGPTGIAADAFGNLYVADEENHRVRKIDPEGIVTTIAGTGEQGSGGDGGPATKAQVYFPTTVAVDAIGNVYVAGPGGRVRKIDSAGLITTLANYGKDIEALALDDEGNVYFGGVYQILRINGHDGGIEVVAGTGEPGFTGDGGPASLARLSISGMAVDENGNVWFADGESRRIRVLERSPPGQ